MSTAVEFEDLLIGNSDVAAYFLTRNPSIVGFTIVQ